MTWSNSILFYFVAISSFLSGKSESILVRIPPNPLSIRIHISVFASKMQVGLVNKIGHASQAHDKFKKDSE
jgi:hypothetical protein